jgi:hypothetical protein
MEWGELFTKGVILGAGAFVIWALWRAAKPRPLFVVRLASGRAAPVSGRVTTAFLQRVAEVAAANQIEQAVIRGFAHGPLIRLHFSSEMSDASRQQLRNWWATHGWGAPYQRPPQCA